MIMHLRMEISRCLKIGWEKQTLFEDGDSLNVMKKTGLVADGEVNHQVLLAISQINRLKNTKAGGLSSFADKNNIYVTIQMELPLQFHP